jgi:hypothetical protein
MRRLLCAALCIAFGAGCAASDSPWPVPTVQGTNVQAMNNLKQFGLAQPEAADVVEPPKGDRARRLVYTAEADLLVDSLTAAEQEMEKLLKSYDGIVANAEKTSRSGQPRSGIWRLRVPVAQFEACLQALASLGELQRSRLDVQDVTRSHSEMEDQIQNLEAEATGLRELLKKPTDKLADTLAAREQLSKLTREIAGLKARFERMQQQAAYSTVTLRLLERGGYVAEGSASLSTAAVRAFWQSCDRLIGLLRQALLAGVGVLPWLSLPLVLLAPIWAWRRLRRR